ncbi:hypothetical protein Tco_0406043, partial [Tanacetum coccineum]
CNLNPSKEGDGLGAKADKRSNNSDKKGFVKIKRNNVGNFKNNENMGNMGQVQKKEYRPKINNEQTHGNGKEKGIERRDNDMNGKGNTEWRKDNKEESRSSPKTRWKLQK